MSRKLAALALLLLSACTEEGASYFESAAVDDGEMRASAEDAWATVGVEAPDGYALFFLDGAVLLDACGWDSPLPGATLGACTPTSDVVLVSTDFSPAQQAVLLAHELGHLLRGGDGKHLGCPEIEGGKPGRDMMCANVPAPGSLPTLRDASFVR